MKTTNAILLGVVGLGAVGAYMFMKNKKAQNALLSGSLPATPTSGIPPLATTPLSSNQVGNLSTTTDGVSPSDANLNLANATVLVGQRVILVEKTKAKLPSTGGFSIGGWGSPISTLTTSNYGAIQKAKKELVELDAKLAKLGYKVDATGALVKI
jgi:hypothetical protein